ncbi:MAG: hypothetical protein CMM90_00550 [Rickettsiales bacterium]|nr:hypothetical protein [Rickettsiales bacterium]
MFIGIKLHQIILIIKIKSKLIFISKIKNLIYVLYKVILLNMQCFIIYFLFTYPCPLSLIVKQGLGKTQPLERNQ